MSCCSSAPPAGAFGAKSVTEMNTFFALYSFILQMVHRNGASTTYMRAFLHVMYMPRSMKYVYGLPVLVAASLKLLQPFFWRGISDFCFVSVLFKLLEHQFKIGKYYFRAVGREIMDFIISRINSKTNLCDSPFPNRK